jgi:hypothetical protein
MVRTIVLSCLLVLELVSTAMTGFSQTPSPATPESAAAFIGDWTLSAEGGQGPAQFALTIKVDAGKLVGSIVMGGGSLPVTDISMQGKTLVLKYNFDYQGSPIDAVVSLTPAGDKYSAEIAFAGGAYTMSGTAEKKK